MSKTKTLSFDLQWLIRQIPGYDPFRDAGDCRFDEEAAQNAIDFFEECLTFSAGPKGGDRFVLEVWQKAVIANLFGWKRPDGTRRYRHCLIYVPRKNGKSELAAGIVCLLLFTDGEPGAQIYSAASQRDQTRYVFDPVQKMIQAEPELASRAELFKYSVVVGDGTYRAICAEATSAHGGNSSAAVVDEAHALPNRELVDVLETSMVARDQPLMVVLTTSDYDRPSICNEILDRAKKARDGVLNDPSFLPVIYEADREDDWQDPEVWAKANPNLGVTITEEAIREKCQKAIETAAFENTFKRLHLNMRTSQSVLLIPMDQWDRQSSGPIDLEALKGKPCFGGLDLATRQDLAAFVLVFGDADEGYKALIFLWCPREQAELRDRKARVPYLTWARQGLIELTEGSSIDYRTIRRRINELGEQYQIREIGFDPWDASQLVTELGEQDGFQMVTVRQGFATMNAPTKELLRLLLDKKIDHGGHAVLRWMADNTAGKTDPAGNLKPDKECSGDKIDGIVALIIALSRAIVAPKGGSVYDERDVRWL
jgi:phage terminase large subunit-like protein